MGEHSERRRPHSDVPTTFFTYIKRTKKLGSGSFGFVYEGKDTRTNGLVAMKLERSDCPTPLLAIEDCMLQELLHTGASGFPRWYWFGSEGEYNVLVMERLGDSVEHRRKAAEGRRMPMTAVRDIACQALDRLQVVHGLGFVYRDVKPHNFVFGVNDRSDVLYLIDFGLCKRVIDPSTKVHIPIRTGKGLTGTPRFASVFTHDGLQHSMRDDIEALGYMLLYLALGELPWQDIQDTKEIGNKKKATNLHEVCARLPTAFLLTIEYARSMSYGTMPDYVALRRFWESAV
jgi:casein kinase 1